MTHQIEIVEGVEGADGLRINGTLFSASEVVGAVLGHRQAVEAARFALAVADIQRAARQRLGGLDHPAARRLLGHIDDAEAQAWAALGRIVEGEPRRSVPRAMERA